jgi:signal transduction histidine kinase
LYYNFNKNKIKDILRSQDLSEFIVLEGTRTFIFIIGALIFIFVSIKRRDLISWLPAYIAGSLSELFRLISPVDYDLFYLIGLGFSSLTVLLMITTVYREYYITFYKSPKFRTISIFQIALIQLIISIGLQIIIGVLLVIAFFMLLRIALKKRTPTYYFFCFILVCGILNLIAVIFRDAGIEGAQEFFEFSSIVMATNLLLTGLVALIEERIVNSEKRYRLAYSRAEFYKDLFVHDINNILQNLQFSLEIISENLADYNIKDKFEEMIMIANDQVNRGAELGLNVKKLSDLETDSINNEPTEVISILEELIKDLESKFPKENLNIRISNKNKKIYVRANNLLEDVFKIILINAIKYNNNDMKEILIKISREKEEYGSKIRIEFIDNGVGIPDMMKKGLLEPVFKKTKDFKRIGLGLLLVNEVIRSVSGKIWIEDRILGDYSKGSNFVLLFLEAHEILDI